MASPTQNKGALNGGRIAYGCTDLSADWPHGGTGLGQVSSVYFAPPDGYSKLDDEETHTTQKILYTGGDCVLGFSARGWHQDTADGVISELFPSVITSNSKDVIEWPGTRVITGEETRSIGNLVYTPWRDAEHPALIFYAATILLNESLRLKLSTMRWLEVPVVAIGLVDGASRVAAMGPLSELSL